MSVERASESDRCSGAPSRYIDDATVRLRILAARFEDLLDIRIKECQRMCERDDTGTCRGHTSWLAVELQRLEDRARRELGRALKDHDLWPFLAERKGLGGPRTAQVISRIGDPRRFPGQKCSEGHTLPPLFTPGVRCPVPRARVGGESDEIHGAGDDLSDAEISGESDGWAGVGSPGTAERDREIETPAERCPGLMLPPRTTTGVRSLWHYAGFHVVDGRAPRRRKGVQSDWNSDLRKFCIGPKGLADQIVLHRTEPYRIRYDEVKAGKLATDLPPWRADKIAKTVAVKAFLGDLLTAWKDLAPA